MNNLTPLAHVGLAPRGAPSLTRRQKAAIIIRLALSAGADMPLQELPEDLQIDVRVKHRAPWNA